MSNPRKRRLRVGDVFRQHDDCDDNGREYEVVRVTPCSASIRCKTRTREEFTTADGNDVSFDRPGRIIQISPFASVVLL